ncbi:MAG: hypothetical protein PHN49_09125, partial [Candidatus Omnitrophica bacterium]|nr:hypothetical protein [Candidatus Omnitrophota bacterium]
MKSILVRSGLLVLGILWATTHCACTPRSYPADQLKEALQKICIDEYGIENVDAKVVDKTIGVYLPLNKLFITDFGDVLKGGKIKNIDSLFEPSPEALDKVEDVLFSLSRVILSTDRSLDFYVLQATDVAKTGLQLTLTGYIDDIKRVRLWDISRNEYRKRVLHELRLNQAVLWHKPVRAFFENLDRMTPEALLEKYFVRDATVDMVQLFFDRPAPAVSPATTGRKWELLDIRSMDLDRQSAAVYVKAKPGGSLALAVPPDTTLEYLFLATQDVDQARIMRIIPFQYR